MPSIRCAMRYVMTRVLPLPAPARINTGPSTASTASRWRGLSLSQKFTVLLNLFCGHFGLALGTLAYFAQVIPGINSALVPIVPLEIDGVFAYRMRRRGLDRRLIHGQQSCGLRLWFARLAVVGLA